jgi:hypothetical protein
MIKGTANGASWMAFVLLALGCGGIAETQVSAGVGGSDAASGAPSIAVAGSSASGSPGIEIGGVAGSSSGDGTAGAPAEVGDATRGKVAYNSPVVGPSAAHSIALNSPSAGVSHSAP